MADRTNMDFAREARALFGILPNFKLVNEGEGLPAIYQRDGAPAGAEHFIYAGVDGFEVKIQDAGEFVPQSIFTTDSLWTAIDGLRMVCEAAGVTK